MFSDDLIQELVAIAICVAAFAFIVWRLKPKKEKPKVQMSDRLRSGLAKAEENRKKD